jgi:hypothetical protein
MFVRYLVFQALTVLFGSSHQRTSLTPSGALPQTKLATGACAWEYWDTALLHISFLYPLSIWGRYTSVSLVPGDIINGYTCQYYFENLSGWLLMLPCFPAIVIGARIFLRTAGKLLISLRTSLPINTSQNQEIRKSYPPGTRGSKHGKGELFGNRRGCNCRIKS